MRILNRLVAALLVAAILAGGAASAMAISEGGTSRDFDKDRGACRDSGPSDRSSGGSGGSREKEGDNGGHIDHCKELGDHAMDAVEKGIGCLGGSVRDCVGGLIDAGKAASEIEGCLGSQHDKGGPGWSEKGSSGGARRDWGEQGSIRAEPRSNHLTLPASTRGRYVRRPTFQ